MVEQKLKEQKLKQKIKEQEKIIEMLSNQKTVRGLISALEDVKKGNYITLTNY
ncbi:hypothetical protein KAT36_00575 [Candidatus Pacearchaeota archaeon]|nr:hypothetical protein [Candidatus Pacearchaeota archaeon]